MTMAAPYLNTATLNVVRYINTIILVAEVNFMYILLASGFSSAFEY
jgi:hypothetical protein